MCFQCYLHSFFFYTNKDSDGKFSSKLTRVFITLDLCGAMASLTFGITYSSTKTLTPALTSMFHWYTCTTWLHYSISKAWERQVAYSCRFWGVVDRIVTKPFVFCTSFNSLYSLSYNQPWNVQLCSEFHFTTHISNVTSSQILKVYHFSSVYVFHCHSIACVIKAWEKIQGEDSVAIQVKIKKGERGGRVWNGEK